MYDFEGIFDEIAPMGRFQMLYVFVYVGFWTIRAMSTVSIIMIAATPDFKCAEQNVTSKCYMPNISDTHNIDSGVCTEGNSTDTCFNGYVYDCSTWENTATIEWDLICDRRTLHSVGTFMYFLGAFFSSFVGGMISDKIGRKPVMILGSLFCAVCNFSVAMVPNMTWFCIVRFLVPIFGFAAVMASFNYVVEITSKEWRILVGIHSNSVFGLGIILLAPLSYFVRDWRMLQISISLLLLPFCLAFCWFPESPRWLYAYNRVDECNKVLNRIAKFNNRKPINPEEWEKFKSDETGKKDGNDEWISPITMIRNYPTVSKITGIMMFEWFAICLVYYGITLNAGSLAGNIFVNTALIGLMDFLGCAICHPLVKRFGCRRSLFVFMAIAGFTCLLSMLAIQKDPVLQKMGVVFAMIGKFTISGTFAIVYLYVAEIFPTDIRTTTLGTSSAIARVGSMISPFAIQLQESVPCLPQTLFGILSLVGAILIIFLPETHRKPILTSSQEAEQKYKFRKSSKNTLVHKMDSM